MLFHEIFGAYYRAAAMILRDAVRKALTKKDLQEYIRKAAFGESMLAIPEGLTGEKWRLLHRDLSTPLRQEPSMPLTTLEKRWLKALLADPRIQLFGSDSTGLEDIDPRIQLFQPDMTGLTDVEPLFTPDMIVYYDRYTDGDPFTDPDYIRHFQTILQALREGQDLYISFETGGSGQKHLSLTPHFLEYSEKDDRFRLIASDRKRRWTINLSRIAQCEPAFTCEHFPLPEPDMAEVTFELEDRRRSMERVLLHFSHLEKKTKRMDDTHYRVTLRYDRQDETEMVIRILSFGPAVRVTEPEHFIGLIRERIEKQRRIPVSRPE